MLGECVEADFVFLLDSSDSTESLSDLSEAFLLSNISEVWVVCCVLGVFTGSSIAEVCKCVVYATGWDLCLDLDRAKALDLAPEVVGVDLLILSCFDEELSDLFVALLLGNFREECLAVAGHGLTGESASKILFCLGAFKRH